MLSNYIVPKRLKTTHFPGQEVEIWVNDQKIQKITDVKLKERNFIRDFITNLEELGWTVRIQKK